MTRTLSLDELWDADHPSNRIERFSRALGRPESAHRYLQHAIAPGTPLAAAVRLHMHGEIKLGRWFPFKAEQIIRSGRGMIWRATAQLYGLPIRGSGRLVESEAVMRWKLFGLIPIVTASGPDITQSTMGRIHAESVWLPPVLCRDEVAWSEVDSTHICAHVETYGDASDLWLTVDGDGRLEAIRLMRWGNPEGGEFQSVPFGGVVEDEGEFAGNTIPTRLRIGWYVGTDRFESEGEFFRVTIDDVKYR